MSEPLHPTSYPGVNEVLAYFAAEICSILRGRFTGLYLTGSLALGDFDPHTSDIDFIVLTDASLSPDHVEAVRDLHTRFDKSSSPWAGKIEANYITPAALVSNPLSTEPYPQVEKETPLFVAPLESGWIFHLYTLREHGITVVGSNLRSLIDPIDQDDMRRAAAPVAEQWLEQSKNDLTWLDWVREQKYQAFVVLTLCRLLYTLVTGAVTSKPVAARWAAQALEPHWTPLIFRALAAQHSRAQATESDIAGMLIMLAYTVDWFQQWFRKD